MGRAASAFCALLITVALTGCDRTTAEEHLANAETRLQQGELRTAVIELKNALQKAPDLAQARLLLGEAHNRLGDYPSALKEFERALDLGLNSDRVRLGLLRAKVNLGRFHEVIGELEGQGELAEPFAVVLGDAYLQGEDLTRAEAMYSQASEHAGAQLGLGLITWHNNDVRAARAHFQRAVELDPESPQAWLRKGEFELSQERFDAAAAAFSEALAHPAGELMGRVGLTRTHMIQGNLESASEQIRQLLKSAPTLPMAHYLDGLMRFEQQDIDGAEAAIREVQRLAPGHGPSQYLMGAIKYRQGQFPQAEDNLQRFLAQEPRHESASKLLASVRFERGDFEKAIEALEPLRRSSADPQVLAMYGTAQLRLGNAAQAVEALEAAVELAPDMAPFRNQLALGLLAAGDQTRAEAELDSAIEVDGGQFQSDYLLAMVRLRDQDWEGASEAVESLISKSPDSPIGYNLRGAIDLAQEQSDAAEAAFEAALQRDAAFLPAVQNLARLHLQQEAPERAIARYQTFIEHHPGHEGALLALAQIALRQGDRDSAVTYLQRAVEADPAHVRSRLALARIRFAENQLAEAGRLVDQALAEEPNLPDLLLLRGDIDVRSGDMQGARRAAARLQSNLAEYGKSPQLHLALGTLQARTGEAHQARRNLELVLSLGEEYRVPALRVLARLELQQRNVGKARQRLNESLAAAGDEADSRMLRADILLAENKRQEAEPLLEALAEEGVREAVVRLAALEVAEGSADAAAARLEAWLEEQPGDLGAELLLAEALMQQDGDRAVERYESLADSGNPVVLNNLAWLYMERGDERALDMAQRAAAAAPDNPDVLDTLGWILYQEGQVDQAVTQLRRSVQLNPNNATAQDHLEQALQSLDQ